MIKYFSFFIFIFIFSCSIYAGKDVQLSADKLTKFQEVYNQRLLHIIAEMNQRRADWIGRYKSSSDQALLREAVALYPNDIIENATAEMRRSSEYCALYEEDAFFNGKADDQVWEKRRGATDTGFRPCRYIKRKDQTPSQALKNFMENFSFADCAVTSAELPMYLILREVLGDDLFDRLFQTIESSYGKKFAIDQINKDDTPFILFMNNREIGKLQVGDRVHISSASFQQRYHQKHPYGEAAGFNVVIETLTPEMRFRGFGLDGSLTLSDVGEHLKKGYDSFPLMGSSILRRDPRDYAQHINGFSVLQFPPHLLGEIQIMSTGMFEGKNYAGHYFDVLKFVSAVKNLPKESSLSLSEVEDAIEAYLNDHR